MNTPSSATTSSPFSVKLNVSASPSLSLALNSAVTGIHCFKSTTTTSLALGATSVTNGTLLLLSSSLLPQPESDTTIAADNADILKILLFMNSLC